jgi:hypothetical protein
MRGRLTFAPCLVEGDDLVDELDGRESAALGLADDVRVAALVGAEEVDVEHRRVRRRRWGGNGGPLGRGGGSGKSSNGNSGGGAERSG